MIGAFAAAALFGLGTVCIGYLHTLVVIDTFTDAMRITIPYFFAVFLVAALLSLFRPGRRVGLRELWNTIGSKGRIYLLSMTAGNAASGWCFFAMLKRIDPLTASLIMALSVILNFLLARVFLGEDTGLSTKVGRAKWISFGFIFAGVLLTSVYSVRTSGEMLSTGVRGALIGFLSAMFASVRMVSAKGVFSEFRNVERSGVGSDRQDPSDSSGLSMTVNRTAYAGAALITLPILFFSGVGDGGIAKALLPHPFLLAVAGIYGLGYAFWYSSLVHIEASRMQLITRSNGVFAAIFMLGAYHLLGIGSPPAWIQIPAAALVITGAAFSTRTPFKPVQPAPQTK